MFKKRSLSKETHMKIKYLKEKTIITGLFVLQGFAMTQGFITSSHVETFETPNKSSSGVIVIKAQETVVEHYTKPEEVSKSSLKEQIIEKIKTKFQEDADKAIQMLSTCENRSLSPTAINKANSNGTWDVGVFQINVDPSNTTEVEKLKNIDYNIERAFKKFISKNRTFYHWTCGYVVGDYTYLDYLRGVKP